MRFLAFIHTLQIGTRYEILPIEEAYRKPYVVKKPFFSSEHVHYVINPNKFGKQHIITSVAECIDTITAIIDDLLLTDYEWRIERIDVAIDTTSSYDELYKLNCYLKELFAIRTKCSNAYRVIGDDMRKRSTVVRCERYELEIYNKHLESGNTSLPQTRCEFRYKRLYRRKMNSWQGVILQAVEKTREILQCLPDYISELDTIKKSVLKATYQRENALKCEGRTRNLSAFVTKYADFIYTRNSLKTLYSEMIDGDFNCWLYRFRRNGNVLSLINRSIFKFYCRRLRTALASYLENGAKAPDLEIAG